MGSYDFYDYNQSNSIAKTNQQSDGFDSGGYYDYDTEVAAREYANDYLLKTYGLGGSKSLIDWKQDEKDPKRGYFMVDGEVLFETSPDIIKNQKTMYGKTALEMLLDKWANKKGYKKYGTDSENPVNSLIAAKSQLDSARSQEFDPKYSNEFQTFLKDIEKSKKDRTESIKNTILQDSQYNNSSKVLSSLVYNSQNQESQIKSGLQSLRNAFNAKKQAEIDRLLQLIDFYEREAAQYEKTHFVPKSYTQVIAEYEEKKRAEKERS